jgi:integrase
MIQQRDTQRLTKRVVDKAACPPTGQLFLRDADLPGFGVRLTKGQKTFILEKRILGRRRRLTIGPFGPLTVEQARTKAEQLAGRIAAGEDPAQERLDTQHELTFGRLIDLYLERHGPRKKTAKADKNRLERHVSDWKTWRLSAITRAEVARRHSQIGASTPYDANRLLALLSRMFNLAHVWGVYAGENPTVGVERFPEVTRDRFVQPDELPRLFKSIEKELDPYIRTGFLTSLLTGARIGEVLSMQWDHVSLEQAVWRLPETKAGRPHLLPLPGPVLNALRTLPRLEGNPFVFPSHGKQGHLTDLSRAWARLCERAKLADLRIHDLRRTLGSWLAVSGASLTLIGKVLNHSQVSTTQIYARLNLDSVREALEANAKKMIQLAKPLRQQQR